MTASTQTIDQATRIAAGATRTRYDGTSIALHWTTVALVIALFALGELWGYAARPVRHQLVTLHMSLGILLGLAVAFRLIWRLMPGHAVPPVATGPTETAARAVHWLLYALLIVQSIYGYIVRWAEGEAMSFFGLLIPSPMTPVSRPTHSLLQDIHGWIGWAIIIVALGHAAAALYHHFVLRDEVLVRMLPRGSKD